MTAERGVTRSGRTPATRSHAPSQVIAVGSTHYDDGHISLTNKMSHGLHSRFDWSVGA